MLLHFFSSQDYAMNYWRTNGAPAEKLLVGFPAYGNTFTLKDASKNGVGAPIAGAGTPGKYTQEAGELAYFEVPPPFSHLRNNKNLTTNIFSFTYIEIHNKYTLK